MHGQGSYTRRLAAKGTKWVVMATAGVGGMKLASNKIEETHADVSRRLSLPFDTLANGASSVGDHMRSLQSKGLRMYEEIKFPDPFAPAGYRLSTTAGDLRPDEIQPKLEVKPVIKAVTPESISVKEPAASAAPLPTIYPPPPPPDEDEEKKAREKELEKQKELEEKERELEKQQEIEKQRELERQLELERQRELERQAELQRELELQRQAELERIEMERALLAVAAAEEAERRARIEEENQLLKDELNAAESVRVIKDELQAANQALKGSIDSLKAESHKTETELRKELLKLQESYKRELDRIRGENDKLKYLVKNSSVKTNTVKKSIIDMYADVLDTLSDNDRTYSVHDHLPRIVVVGDQSAGKTSVLEMIVRARIFPRGHGEMMTRSPVQVTLGEGNRHTAQFNDSQRVYDLSSDNELQELRDEVERRMKRAVKAGGETISTETISMTVKGPGLHRMVLVDLPGIISTETTGMRPRTKEALHDMCSGFMRNPNAIILCVQDGSIDAERSNITNLVQAHDPKGKRTIFVLTKVDLAEKNMANPTRVKKILEGKLFPMKALGYYAVVTGRGPQEDSIETIRAYEEDFFSRSKLFRSGAMRASQMSTNNLSLAVSDCFWKMVRDSVEQQSDVFKATRYNLEAEWRNTFPGIREMDRNDLFEKAKDEILDKIAALHKLTPLEWETLIQEALWTEIQHKVVDEIYLEAAECHSVSHFNTQVDIALKDWTDDTLPRISVDVGWQTLFSQLSGILMSKGGEGREFGDLFHPLKGNILDTVKEQHSWQHNATSRLSVIQKNALEDTAVTNKMQWDNSILFMERILKERIELAAEDLGRCIGPGWKERWTGWRSRSPLEVQCVAAKNELQRLLLADEQHGKHLENDELTTVRRNLQTQGVDVPYDIICKVWEKLYKLNFLNRAMTSAQQCRKAFYHRNIACNAVECNDVVLFWRANKMLEITSNALRLQIMNTEAQRLEKEVKQYLEDLSHDEEKKKALIKGKRVDLAEELRKVRGIQDKLDTFIEELKKDHQ